MLNSCAQLHGLCVSSCSRMADLLSCFRLSAGVFIGRLYVPASSAAFAAIFHLIPARLPLLPPAQDPHTGQPSIRAHSSATGHPWLLGSREVEVWVEKYQVNGRLQTTQILLGKSDFATALPAAFEPFFASTLIVLTPTTLCSPVLVRKNCETVHGYILRTPDCPTHYPAVTRALLRCPNSQKNCGS